MVENVVNLETFATNLISADLGAGKARKIANPCFIQYSPNIYNHIAMCKIRIYAVHDLPTLLT